MRTPPHIFKVLSEILWAIIVPPQLAKVVVKSKPIALPKKTETGL
jgi:hypothetical protein